MVLWWMLWQRRSTGARGRSESGERQRAARIREQAGAPLAVFVWGRSSQHALIRFTRVQHASIVVLEVLIRARTAAAVEVGPIAGQPV